MENWSQFGLTIVTTSREQHGGPTEQPEPAAMLFLKPAAGQRDDDDGQQDSIVKRVRHGESLFARAAVSDVIS